MTASSLAVIVKFDFDLVFEALTQNQPYPWQRQLFELIAAGNIPPDINLPTGAGKTSIMPIWLLALAKQASAQPSAITIPRRLVWVVNRRVVVDQATDEAEEIRKRLADRQIASLEPVREALRKLCLDADGDLVAISTLRGEKEDNREWSNDPSRPAIIVGTVDMIGSRLLFSGYGDGRYWRAQHAGLIGHDSLIVNDEAHLTRAFADLLSKIEEKQAEGLKPFRTLRLSATHSSPGCWPDSLEEDNKDKRFQRVFKAQKKLYIRDAGKQHSTLLELAMQPGPARTLVFVETPEKVAEIAERLRKKLVEQAEGKILTLTGTMRGIERDQMVEHPVFKAFAGKQKPSESFWLVATNAGEVGVNISSDCLISELDTLDHLLQRFGRLNRFGETTGEAYVLIGDSEKKKERKAAALKFLQNLDKIGDGDDETYDISAAALFGRALPVEACSEAPLQAELHDWLIDVWSQTTLGRHPARPDVEPWLHGKQDDIPETYIAWREDVCDLARDGIDDDERQEVLEKYRLLSHEQLREPTPKLLEKLEKLAHLRVNNRARVLCRRQDGRVDVLSVSRFADLLTDREKRKAIGEIANCQLIFPPGCGRLENGMLQPTWEESEKDSDTERENCDVGGSMWNKKEGKIATSLDRASYRATKNEDGKWILKRLGVTAEEVEQLDDLELKTLRSFAAPHELRFLLKVAPPDGEEGPGETALLYFSKVRPKSESMSVVPLLEHVTKVGEVAAKLAQSAGLAENLVQAFQWAGQLHDLGKEAQIWQRAAGNLNPDGSFKSGGPVAKPIETMNGKSLGGFRHELASLLCAEALLQAQSSECRDLVLHLVAAHHGHARPGFDRKAFDRNHLSDSARIALDSVQRFARLQRKFGAWGIAYLEAILKAADGVVSAAAVEQPNNG